MSRKSKPAQAGKNKKSAGKALVVTLITAAVIIAGVVASLTGLRFVLHDGTEWAISGYSGFSRELEIPDKRLGLPVTAITDHAFFLGDVESVSLGSNVEKLGGYAFYGCESLESVQLNYGLVSIDEFCFGECDALRELAIPSTVTQISESAFIGCSDLTIFAPEGSYAAQYAAEYNIKWVAVEEAIAVQDAE